MAAQKKPAAPKKPAVSTLSENASKNLAAVRLKRGESQATFAKVLGCSTSYVSMLERAEREMPLSTIEAFATKLKIPPLTLLLASPKL
jgi:transcriptional regulator with XRE-family HTH domain